MPEGLTDTLTRGELVDLVRFLSEMGKVGPFQVGKERVVRRWQVLEPEREAYGPLYREGIAATASDAAWQTWSITSASLLEDRLNSVLKTSRCKPRISKLRTRY